MLHLCSVANTIVKSFEFNQPIRKPWARTKWSGSDAVFATYSLLNYTAILKLGFRVTQGHRKWRYSIKHTTLYYFDFYSKYVSTCIYYHFRDIAAYWSKIAIPLYSVPPLGLNPSDLRNDRWPIRQSQNFDDAFSPFDTMHAFDRRTDGIAVLAIQYNTL